MSSSDQPKVEEPNSSPTSTPKSPSKRSQTVVEAEQEPKEEDDEDEEPVRKRSRRTEPQNAGKVGVKKSATVQSRDPTKSAKATKPPKVVKEELEFESPHKNDTAKLEANGSRAKRHVEEEDQKPGNTKAASKSAAVTKSAKAVQIAEQDVASTESEVDDEEDDLEEEKPEVAAKAREKVQSTLQSQSKDPYPDWKPGESVPYAALCTTFSLVEMTTKRLIISAHCSLFLRQVLRLTPEDLLPTVQLMINKLAADYAGIELGIGESLIMKAIGESTGRSLAVIKADQNEIGDLGLVAAKSRSNQPTMFKPKALTVRGVLDGLMGIATVQGSGSQGRKVDGIKKLLSAADVAFAGKGSKGVDITKDKGGASEAKFIIRFLEGKLRLGLAEKTVLVALAHAMVIHEIGNEGKKVPSSEQLAKGEAILKTVYR